MRARWITSVVAGAIAVVGLAIPAQAAPGCDQILGPETCAKYYYSTQEELAKIVDPLYAELYETEDEAVELVLWAVDTYNGIYNCTVPWGYCPD